MPKETITTRVAVVEKELEMREEIIKLEFKNIHAKLDGIDTYLKNGLSKDIAQQIRNGSANGTKFGIKAETRDKIVLWAMRIAVFSLAGKEGVKFLLG